MSAPIFIVGTPRSGTTLTAKILGRHSALYLPGETHFFDDVFGLRDKLGEVFTDEVRARVYDKVRTLYGRYNEPADQERVEGLERAGCDFGRDEWTSYQDVLSALMEYPMEAEGKVRWGNNTPRDIFHVHRIIEFYPDAKVVVCVRDVRDFLLSYQGKWKATAENEVDRLKQLYHPVVTSLLWKASMKQVPAIKRMVPEGNLYILKYESLVTEPEAVVRKLCEVVGVEFEQEMLDVGAYGSSHGQGRSGVYSSSVGKWRDQLPAEESFVAQMIVGKEMTALGYEPESIRANPFNVVLSLLGAPLALGKALHANRHKRGALLPYLLKRVRSLAGKS